MKRIHTLLCLVVLFTASAQAQSQRAIRLAMEAAPVGFDPQAMDDAYAADVILGIFGKPLEYDYLTRPVQIVPGLLEKPTISADGKTFTLRVRRGFRFADDPAFGGKARALTAADFVYTWKRLLDPKLASPYMFLFEGKLLGESALRERLKAGAAFDYDAPIEGLRLIDENTFEIKFLKPNFQFEFDLATNQLSPVAREVIEKYRDPRGRAPANPVGVGPYRLAQWERGRRIVLEANPYYVNHTFPSVPASAKTLVSPEQFDALKKLEGRALPITKRVEFSVIEESVPRLLSFQKGDVDALYRLPRDLRNRVFDGGNLKPEFSQKGIVAQRIQEPSLNFRFFNMDHPITGGMSREKIALRRAILMGLNGEEEVRIIYQGQAIAGTQLVPPEQFGHDKTLNARPAYDPELANKLLDRFGYKDRDGDGFREMPDGSSLTLTRASMPEAHEREVDELWQKNLKAIGIRYATEKQKWGDLIEMARLGKVQVWGFAWHVGSPSGSGFTELLYSKNIGQLNDARFNVPAYDQAYERAQTLPFGPERLAEMRKMSEIAAAYSVFDFGVVRFRDPLTQPWLKGLVAHPYDRMPYWFWDVQH